MKDLAGLRILITSGPTREPLDPVRYLTNFSSGKQGHSIAIACAERGAEVVLISGPVALPDPAGMQVIHVNKASEMLAESLNQLENKVDVAICAAAVSDWCFNEINAQKLKKQREDSLTVTLVKTPDILAAISNHPSRPRLVVGFAAETENLIPYAASKRQNKGCDWILANDVSGAVFGAEDNTIHFITQEGAEAWPVMSKKAVGERLAERIAASLAPRRRRPGLRQDDNTGKLRLP